MTWGQDELHQMGGVIQFVRTDEKATLPSKAHSDDACFDLYSCEKRHLYPSEALLVDTGYRIALPKGYAGLVCSRSGLAANKSVFVLNAPGMIDAGYRGSLKVILYNASEDLFPINIGDRIGQLFIQKVLPFTCVEVEAFDEQDTDRGEGGFGSTGS